MSGYILLGSIIALVLGVILRVAIPSSYEGWLILSNVLIGISLPVMIMSLIIGFATDWES